MRCAAFPEGIPAAIAEGSFVHTEEFPGDNGLRFDPADHATAELAQSISDGAGVEEEIA
jgi:hypothetical protein